MFYVRPLAVYNYVQFGDMFSNQVYVHSDYESVTRFQRYIHARSGLSFAYLYMCICINIISFFHGRFDFVFNFVYFM